jgi:hypothetical protein
MLRCESKDSDDVQRKPMKSSDECKRHEYFVLMKHYNFIFL